MFFSKNMGWFPRDIWPHHDITATRIQTRVLKMAKLRVKDNKEVIVHPKQEVAQFFLVYCPSLWGEMQYLGCIWA